MSVSDEEFQRFQNQLLDLKTKTYQLEEQNRKLSTENLHLKTQIEKNDKDGIGLRLATKTLLKLRPNSSRDLEEVQRENESLTRKLHEQEEAFKLQNATTMRELNECTNKIDALENELKLFREGRHSNSNNVNNVNDIQNQLNEENRRLKAENIVLQKKLTELSAKTVESISTASSSNESFPKDDVEIECDENRETGLVHVVSNKTTFSPESIRFETDLEEKRLLQEQIHQLEQTTNETIGKLNKQIESLKEKLDEKQNTCLSLQHDYEKRIQEMIAENATIKTNHENQLESLKTELKRIQDDEIVRYQKRLNDLQMTVDQLESQIGTVAAEQNQELRLKNAEHQRILEDKELLLSQTIIDRDSLRNENEQSKEAYETLLQTVQALEQQVTKTTRELENSQRLAEQRLTTIDEMQAKLLQEDEKSRTSLQKQKEKHQNDVERYEKEINELKIKDRTFKQLQSRCTELEARLQSEEEVKRVLTNRLEDLQNEICQLNEKFEEMKRENDENVQNLTEILNTKALTIEELNGQIDSLRQEISTFNDEKRAHERKGAALMKDLQKQLNAEKKRNERMQEKLTELLSGDKAALDELFYIPKSDGSRQGDTASVSSFGGGGGGAMSYYDRASVTSNQMSSLTLEQENKELIQKLDRKQKECAILEEKVRHLELSNSTMASDIIQYRSTNKTIGSPSPIPNRLTTPLSRRQHGSSVDRQSQSSNLRSMLENFSRTKTHSNHEDEIKNLQRLLEETLTKNMHLQKDLEAMSLQIQQQTEQTSNNHS